MYAPNASCADNGSWHHQTWNHGDRRNMTLEDWNIMFHKQNIFTRDSKLLYKVISTRLIIHFIVKYFFAWFIAKDILYRYRVLMFGRLKNNYLWNHNNMCYTVKDFEISLLSSWHDTESESGHKMTACFKHFSIKHWCIPEWPLANCWQNYHLWLIDCSTLAWPILLLVTPTFYWAANYQSTFF